MHAYAITRVPSYLDDEPTIRDTQPWHRMTAPARPRRRQPTEAIESLSLPDGLREEMLPIGAAPDGPVQARIWLVRMARDLARDYRAWYGVALRTDASAIERMQWHLSTAVQPLGRRDEKAVARELVRHGLLLGEIVARSLGATWIDLTGDRPGKWELFVPPAATLSPIVRVQRFVQRGMSEMDLVALFLELDAAERHA